VTVYSLGLVADSLELTAAAGADCRSIDGVAAGL